jgi:hypothetical protein
MSSWSDPKDGAVERLYHLATVVGRNEHVFEAECRSVLHRGVRFTASCWMGDNVSIAVGKGDQDCFVPNGSRQGRPSLTPSISALAVILMTALESGRFLACRVEGLGRVVLKVSLKGKA